MQGLLPGPDRGWRRGRGGAAAWIKTPGTAKGARPGAQGRIEMRHSRHRMAMPILHGNADLFRH